MSVSIRPYISREVWGKIKSQYGHVAINYGVDVEAKGGESWLVGFLLANQVGMPVPETPREKAARAGKTKKRGESEAK